MSVCHLFNLMEWSYSDLFLCRHTLSLHLWRSITAIFCPIPYTFHHKSSHFSLSIYWVYYCNFSTPKCIMVDTCYTRFIILKNTYLFSEWIRPEIIKTQKREYFNYQWEEEFVYFPHTILCFFCLLQFEKLIIHLFIHGFKAWATMSLSLFLRQ